MALPQPGQPLTEAEARKMVDDWRKDWPAIPSFYDMLVEAMNEPTPHKVYYEGGKPFHVPPADFYWSKKPASPSVCEWIVPGTHTREFNSNSVRIGKF